MASLSWWNNPITEDDEVDAAIAFVLEGRATPAILDIPVFTPDLKDPMPNAVVVKSGRTTGRTWGYISNVDMRYAPLNHQIQISPLLPVGPFALPGDDGALVLQVCPTPTGEPGLCPVGLLWAFDGIKLGRQTGPQNGVAYANPIKHVIGVLNKKSEHQLTFVPSTKCDNKFPFTNKSSDDSQVLTWKDIPLPPGPVPNSAVVRAAIEINDRNQERLWRIPGVLGTAVGLSETGSGQVVIKLFVAQKTGPLKQAISSGLDGIPIELELHGAPN